MHALRYELQQDGVAVVFINIEDSPQNVLRPSMKDELHAALDRGERDGVKAIVFASDKPGSFIAGADIRLLEKVQTADEAAAMSRDLQAALNRLASLDVPTVAAIDGACLGGGLEFALACRHRVATSNPKTRLGLPEVQLGLLPGAGGTQRLPPLVGLESALDLMLTGREVGAAQAKKLGLVNDVVPPAILLRVAMTRGLELAAAPLDGEEHSSSLRSLIPELTDAKALQHRALAGNPIGRTLIFRQAEKVAEKKAGGHYPAVTKILEVVRTGLDKGMAAGLEAEANAFGELAMTGVAHRLMDIFFATLSSKKDSGVSDPNVEPLEVSRVGVLGAGLMGHGIAFVTIHNAGAQVLIKDRDDTSLGIGLRSVHRLVEERVEKNKLTQHEAQRVLFRMRGASEKAELKGCQVVIEAAFEDIALKQELLRSVEQVTDDSTIFASNTSSIPIHRIAEASHRKHRVIGMHYFSPVQKMPLLEVIRTTDTSDETVVTCVELGKRQGKTVIVVNDGVGFYTSRILGPYMNEAAWMLVEGIPIEVVDDAARRLGFPVGPVTLLDEIGIDVAAKVGRIAEEAFGGRLHAPSSLERLVEDGRTGRKSKKGFYCYGPQRKKKEVDPTVYDVLGVKPDRKRRVEVDVLQDRLLVMMTQEAIRCFDERVVRSARDADIGAVFGLGFPPYLGGPLRWVDSIGPSELLRRMRGLQDRFGGRFEPPPVLERMAREGIRFHD
ncbi:MAG: fatty acid oxidation complex subunit alpha FadJ [Myxococcota bacterium]